MAGNARTGGQILIDCLVANDVDRVFCVPGESYLAALDAFHDAPSIDLVVCRQEGGAAYMADADGKMTGRPGICFVTRGPGATNASGGVHVAFQDSTPMILFVGQVARGMEEREAFQEIDFRRMFGPMVKWVAQIEDAARIPEFVNRAFNTAMAGRPGPVVLALPEDMLTDIAEAADIGRAEPPHPNPAPTAMNDLRDRLAAAKSPLLVLGGGGWSTQACDDIRVFAEANALPVAASFRCQDLIDNTHANYAGDIGIGINPDLKARVDGSDLLIIVGARLGEMTTGGYTMIDIPNPRQPLVHVHPGAEEIGRVYQPALGIHASVSAFARAARALAPVTPNWNGEADRAHQSYLKWTEPPTIPGDVQMGEIAAWVRNRVPSDTICANGAGNFSVWANRYFRYGGFRTLLGPTSGTMGYGVPAAVAAKARHPERTVICYAGDGDFLMNGQEFATAAQYGLAIIVLLVNNGMYGTIRMHQEREYPGRISGTGLANPDFAALARAYGGHGETVEKTEQFEPAFERAMASGLPAIIELRVDPEAITPATTLSNIRAAALARAKS